MSLLPPELLYGIIAHLDDKRDVAAASLIGYRWLAPARASLFASLAVYDDRSSKDFYAFTLFVNSSSMAPQAVRHLTLHGCRTYQSKPVITPQLLDRILSKLPSLQSLCLESVAFSHEVEPDDSETLKLVGSYRLERLAINRCGTLLDTATDFLNCLSIFSSLCELTIRDLESFNDVPIPIRYTTAGGCTISLENIFSYAAALPIPPLPSVTRLSLAKVGDAEFMYRILEKAGVQRSLTHIAFSCKAAALKENIFSPSILSLVKASKQIYRLAVNMYHIPWFTSPTHEPFLAYLSEVGQDLASITTLREAALYFGIDSSNAVSNTAQPSWIVSLAAISMLPSSIRRLELTLIDDHPRRRYAPPEDRGHIPLWLLNGIDLHDLRIPLERFESLEKVTFRCMDGIREDEMARMAAQLPEMAAKGILCFDPSLNNTRECIEE